MFPRFGNGTDARRRLVLRKTAAWDSGQATTQGGWGGTGAGVHGLRWKSGQKVTGMRKRGESETNAQSKAHLGSALQTKLTSDKTKYTNHTVKEQDAPTRA